MRRYSALFILLAFCMTKTQAQEYRDVVFMKNGSVIKGFFKELYPDDSLHMETIDGGIFICSLSDVLRIAKERTSIYVIDTQNQLPPRVWRPKGYRGAFEYEKVACSYETDIILSSMITTHGYQFNPYLFTGLGIGIQLMEVEKDKLQLTFNENIIPVFAEVQLNILKTRFSPFIDARLGYLVKGFKGLYFNSSIGVNFGISPLSGGFIAVGYSYEHTNGKSDERKKIEGISYRIGLYF